MNLIPLPYKDMMMDFMHQDAAQCYIIFTVRKETHQLNPISLPIMYFWPMLQQWISTEKNTRYAELLIWNCWIFNLKLWSKRPTRKTKIFQILKSSYLKVQPTQKGSIGMSFDVMWFEPATNSFENKEAAKRAQDFQFGW